MWKRSQMPLVCGRLVRVRMVDVLDRQIELVFVALGIAAILGAAVGQHPAEPDVVLVVERHHPVVEQVGRGDRGLAVIELGERHLGVGVDEGLLVDAPDPLHGADVEGVLRAAIAGALALELAMRLLVRLGLSSAAPGPRSAPGPPAPPWLRAP